MKANFNLTAPSCPETLSGSIQINSIEGGHPPYQYQLEQQPFKVQNTFTQLASGIHQITVKDAFDCLLDTFVNLSTISPLSLNLGMDTTIEQGKPIQLSARTTISAKQIRSIDWIGVTTDTCAEPCLILNFTPLFSANIAAAIQTFDGCEVIDDIEIKVIPQSDIYIPSTFSPNGDGINDIFTIYTGSSINTIQTFKIFDRWGSLVFEAHQIAPNLEVFGWDGSFQNQTIQQGTFFYIVEIEMLDGSINSLSGTITIVM